MVTAQGAALLDNILHRGKCAVVDGSLQRLCQGCDINLQPTGLQLLTHQVRTLALKLLNLGRHRRRGLDQQRGAEIKEGIEAASPKLERADRCLRPCCGKGTL